MQVAKINSVSLSTYKQQKINKQNNQQITAPISNNAEDLSFESLRFNRCGKIFLSPKDLKNEHYFYNDIAHFLNISEEALRPYFRLDKKDRTDFFYDLADNLSKDFFKKERSLNPKESLKILDELYQAVKKPNRTHQTIIKHPEFTFEQKQQLLLLTAEAGPQAELYNKLRHTQDLGRSVSSINWSGEEYLSLLTSPNAEKLNTNFQTFREYIRLNHNKPSFMEDLNRELAQETPSFDPRQLLRQTIIADYSTSAPILRALPQEELLRNWNPEGMELMDFKFTHSFQVSYRGDNYSEENINFYRYLFNTTTKDNLELRKTFFENTYTKPKNQDTNSTIINFLDRIEADENLKTIYQTAIATNSDLMRKSFNEMLYYSDALGADVIVKKLDKFFEIINTTHAEPDEMVQILSKNLNNRFYISNSRLRNLRDDEADIRNTNFFFPETKAQIHRFTRKFKYNFLPKVLGTGAETPIKLNMDYKTYSAKNATAPLKGFISCTEEPTIEAKPKVATRAILTLPNTSKARTAAKPVIRRYISEDYKARKLRIQNDTQEIIKSRMRSAKQIQEQIGDYTKNATKMRNQFLNEMFNSVAETRAQQRARGIKRPTISNADVIEAYKQINGSNKKLFREMLKARTETGERKYNLKEIAKILEQKNIERKAAMKAEVAQKRKERAAAKLNINSSNKKATA